MGAGSQVSGRRAHPLRRLRCSTVVCLLTVACLAGMTQVLTVAGSGALPATATATAPSATGSGANVHNPPPTTTVLLPSNGATQSGVEYLDAGASPPTVTKVVFVLTGGAVGHRVISGSGPSLFGMDRRLEHGHGPRRHLRPAERRLLCQRRERDEPRPDDPRVQRHAAERRLGRGGLVDRCPPRGPDHAPAAQRRRRERGQPRRGRLSRLADHPEPAAGSGLLLARCHDRPADPAVRGPGAGRQPRPDSPLYADQPLHQGLNYITMRDGIELAATVRYPYGGTCSAASPCPTVMEYSGYNVAGPDGPHSAADRRRPRRAVLELWEPELLPDGSTDVGAVVARFSGFATVSLQMRGPGAREAPSTSSATRPTTTPTTPSRSSRTSRGSRTTRSAWSGSASRDSRSSRSAGTDPPGSPPSPDESDR